MLDRDAELSFLWELFTRCARGKGGAAVITGPVATGKTELLHAFAARARRSGASTLIARGTSAQRETPLGVLRQLFRRAPLSPELQVRLIRLLDEGTRRAALAGPDTADAVQLRIAQSLWELLKRMAGQRPVLIGVADLHLADRASLCCLRYFVRGAGSSRVLAVVTEPDRPRRVHQLIDLDPGRRPHCHRVALTPLLPREVTRILASRLDTHAAFHVAADCHALSGGIPLLVQALLEDYRGALTPGAAFARAVLACLNRLESTELAVAQAIAVLGEHGSPDLVARLLGTTRAATANALTVLNAALLDSGRFRHPAARLAALGGMDPQRRDEWERRAADLLQAAPEPAVVPAEPVAPAARPANSLVADPSYALSDAELRVASLATLGYSNREIAGELHITVSTVEQHLTRTYRKLRVNGRAKLAERLLVETSDRG
ncbi:helix-turn-helix transcriptional regulator [Amycolatopsis anabasis]|uniref:helix-turn-helix transcriptional regulator n=1 Tax=Amycolatopsis anabasis TaxID=1840409 RepID=UPI00131D4033|nr:LuxR family transcriptional regulator [Amycolatopsis anabasis]